MSAHCTDIKHGLSIKLTKGSRTDRQPQTGPSKPDDVGPADLDKLKRGSESPFPLRSTVPMSETEQLDVTTTTITRTVPPSGPPEKRPYSGRTKLDGDHNGHACE